jgi:hypothetical protein
MAVQHLKVAAAVAVLTFATAGFADDADQANQDTKALLEYVKKLESRVNQLEQEREWPLDQVRMQSESALESAVRSIRLSGYMEFQYAYNLRHGGSHLSPSGSGSGASGSIPDFPDEEASTSEGKAKAGSAFFSSGTAGLRGDTLNYNLLRGSAPDDNGFSFQNVQLLADKPLGAMNSTGFRIRSQFGQIGRFHSRDGAFSDTGHAFDVREAYMSWRAETGWGMSNYVDLTIGKFDSPLGFESGDQNNWDRNWVVTRDPFHTLLKPATHTGLRAAVPWSDCATTTLYFVNGWDVVRDPHDGKTFIVSQEIGQLGWMNSKVILNGSYGNEGSIYTAILPGVPGGTPITPGGVILPGTIGAGLGGIDPDGNKTWLLEGIWIGEMNADTKMALDAVLAEAENGSPALDGGVDNREFHSVHGSVRHQWRKDMWIGGRAGYFSDQGPAALLGGKSLRGYDLTLALGWNVAENLTMIFEYRHDHATSDTRPFGNTGGGPNANQDTVVASFVYEF